MREWPWLTVKVRERKEMTIVAEIGNNIFITFIFDQC